VVVFLLAVVVFFWAVFGRFVLAVFLGSVFFRVCVLVVVFRRVLAAVLVRDFFVFLVFFGLAFAVLVFLFLGGVFFAVVFLLVIFRFGGFKVIFWLGWMT